MMYHHFFSPFPIYQCLVMLLMLAGCALFLVIAWRFMRAQESLASTLKEIATGIKPQAQKEP